jgi:hypothetical protein
MDPFKYCADLNSEDPITADSWFRLQNCLTDQRLRFQVVNAADGQRDQPSCPSVHLAVAGTFSAAEQATRAPKSGTICERGKRTCG